MRYSTILKNMALAVLAASVTLGISACNSKGPEKEQEGEQPNFADVFIFMGQSNMAGRGEAEDAIPCGEGHAYEFRAVTGNDEDGWLYPLEEPFGKYENNEALSDGGNGDGKKSGGMVSSFCEAYYSQTEVPVIGVSASVGGTSIKLWTPGTDYFEESRRRLEECIDYLDSETDYVVRNINMVWCQGESDGSNVANKGMDYNGMLTDILEGLKSEGVEHCFIIPPSEYGSAAKTVVAEEQIKLCRESDDFVLATLKFRNVPEDLRVDPHFHQGLYNVAGWDAGTNVADFILNGVEPECKEYIYGEEIALAEQFGIDLTYKTSSQPVGDVAAEIVYVNNGSAVNLDAGTADVVSWKSEDGSIAAVDNTGKVTGVGYGVTVVIAETKNGEILKYTVAVVDDNCKIVYGNGEAVRTDNSNKSETFESNPGCFFTLASNTSAVSSISNGVLTLTRSSDSAVTNAVQLRYLPSKNAKAWHGAHIAVFTLANNTSKVLNFSANISGNSSTACKVEVASGDKIAVAAEFGEIPEGSWVNFKLSGFGAGSLTISDIYFMPIG